MNAAATITVEDGDKVNHGWSQLDIAKHSTNTFVSSLGDEDYVSVVTYSDGANVRHASPRPRPRPRSPRTPASAPPIEMIRTQTFRRGTRCRVRG